MHMHFWWQDEHEWTIILCMSAISIQKCDGSIRYGPPHKMSEVYYEIIATQTYLDIH